MKKNKLLFILVPIIVLLIIAIGLFVYLLNNSKPEQIFKNQINKLFKIADTQKYSSIDYDGEISASIESNDEEIQEINKYLENSKIRVQTKMDTDKMNADEKLIVVFDNEELVNFEFLAQDSKMYIALKQWLNKYIEIPDEYIDEYGLRELIENNDENTPITGKRSVLMNIIKEEFIKELMKQEFTQQKSVIDIDGKSINTTESSLILDEEKIMTFTKNFLKNLSQNEKFQQELGEYKEKTLDSINEILKTIDEQEASNNTLEETASKDLLTISIHTKGMFNKFVALDLKVKDEDGVIMADRTFYKSKGVLESQIYKEENGTKNVIATIIVDITDSKNNGNLLNGTTKISLNVPDYGSLNINYKYNIVYNSEIEKVDVSNAVNLNNMSEEDQETLVNNIQKSKLYTIISSMSGIVPGMMTDDNLYNQTNANPQISNNRYSINFNVPEGYNLLQLGNENSKKLYKSGNMDYVQVSLEKNAEDYLRDVENNSILSSRTVTNSTASELKTYEIDGLEYYYKTVEYDGQYDEIEDIQYYYQNSGTYELEDEAKIILLYFVCPIDSETSYVVVIETKGDISLEDINQFLEFHIDIQNSQLMNALEQERQLEEIEPTVNVEELINQYTIN